MPKAVVAVWLVAATVLVGGLLGIAAGQDTNFDQLRQHYYAWYWLLHSRAHVDFFPAAEGGLLPNGWNLPWYLIVDRASPALTMAYLGALSSVLALLLALLFWRVLGPSLSTPIRLSLIALSLLIGLCGPAVVGEFATTFGDIPTALPFLVGLIVLFWTGQPSSGRLNIFLAFTLIGMSPGLKPTNTGWAVAAIIALLCASSGDRWRRTGWALVGTIAGATIAYGPWALLMWHLYRSPTFPLLNRVFHSPDYVDVNFRDPRWMIDSPLDLVRLPFRWLSTSQVSSEVPMRDWRWATILLLVPICLLYCRMETRSEADTSRSRILDPAAATFILVIVFVGFFLTLLQVAYSRYLLIGELLSPLVFIVVLDALALKLLTKFVSLTVIAGVLAASTHTDSWGRADLSGSWFRTSTVASPRHALVFVIDQDPYQYLLPTLGSSNRYIMLGESDARFGAAYQAIRETVRAHRGRAYLLSAASNDDQLPAPVVRDLDSYQLRLDHDACTPVNSIRGPTWLCELAAR